MTYSICLQSKEIELLQVKACLILFVYRVRK
jgi:hypothetical protein